MLSRENIKDILLQDSLIFNALVPHFHEFKRAFRSIMEKERSIGCCIRIRNILQLNKIWSTFL